MLPLRSAFVGLATLFAAMPALAAPQSVPEPGALGMLALAALGGAVALRRRK